VDVLTDDEPEATQFIFPGANLYLEIQGLTKINFKKYDAIYSVTSIPLNYLYKLIDLSSENKIPLFLDFPSKHKEISKKKLEKVDFIMPNRIEALKFLGKENDNSMNPVDVAKLFRNHCKGTILISLDKQGSIVLPAGENIPRLVNNTSSKIVKDTTAAGDIFRASFLIYYLQTKDILKSVKSANKISSWSVGIKGVNNTLDKLPSKLSITRL
jgi:sugar/nucleoside kinase (ribokinase family)